MTILPLLLLVRLTPVVIAAAQNPFLEGVAAVVRGVCITPSVRGRGTPRRASRVEARKVRQCKHSCERDRVWHGAGVLQRGAPAPPREDATMSCAARAMDINSSDAASRTAAAVVTVWPRGKESGLWTRGA